MLEHEQKKIKIKIIMINKTTNLNIQFDMWYKRRTFKKFFFISYDVDLAGDISRCCKVTKRRGIVLPDLNP